MAKKKSKKKKKKTNVLGNVHFVSLTLTASAAVLVTADDEMLHKASEFADNEFEARQMVALDKLIDQLCNNPNILITNIN